MKRYTVSPECIGCRACVEVAPDNFDVDNDNMAYLKIQPETDKHLEQCQDALEVCPVDAIAIADSDATSKLFPILAKSNIKQTLDKYPQLKTVLINLSPKFAKMQNPVLYNTIARFADFNDAAKLTDISTCEILHTINKHLGVEDKLLQTMPECANQIGHVHPSASQDILWKESPLRYVYNNDAIEELVPKVSNLIPQDNIVIISVSRPSELMKIAEGHNFIYNLEDSREFRLSIFNPATEEVDDSWENRKEQFETLDVRESKNDPFDMILKKANSIREKGGFTLIQKFEPHPMINMITEMGFEHITEQKGLSEYRVYFYKTPEKRVVTKKSDIVEVVIQSATPVAYPVITRLMQSTRLKKHIKIKELKVWEETEKHLAWITGKKADISFSALITAAKLKSSDIKIPALFVWDNFVLLSRSKATSFKDLQGKDIYTPLFEEAPPAKITKYLISASGLNPDDFNFVYGKPFGRPEKIYKDFVSGKSDVAILREPEASWAIKVMHDRQTPISVISFNKIWNEINPGFGSFPNAGLVLKGEFVRNYPKQTQIFLEELKLAIDWVNSNRGAAAKLSSDVMRQSVDKVEMFLDRVNFNYVEGKPLEEKVKQYFNILNQNKVTNVELNSEFLSMFAL